MKVQVQIQVQFKEQVFNYSYKNNYNIQFIL